MSARNARANGRVVIDEMKERTMAYLSGRPAQSGNHPSPLNQRGHAGYFTVNVVTTGS